MAGGIVILFLLRSILLTYATYALWSTALPSTYLLPPYQPISYFLHYSFIHFFASFLLTFAVGLTVGIILLFLNYRRPHLFMPGDLALLLIGMLLVQWPLVIFYVGAIFMGGMLLLIFRRYIIKGKETIVLAPHILFWIPLFLLLGNMLMVFFTLQPLAMPL